MGTKDKGPRRFPLVQLPKKFRGNQSIVCGPKMSEFPLVQLPKKFRVGGQAE